MRKWWDNNSSSLSFVVLSQRWSFCLINQFLLRASHPCWVGSRLGQRRWGVLVTLRVQSQKSNYESKDEPNFFRGGQHCWKGVTWLSTFTSLDIEQEMWVLHCYSQMVKDVVLCKWMEEPLEGMLIDFRAELQPLRIESTGSNSE